MVKKWRKVKKEEIEAGRGEIWEGRKGGKRRR